MEGFILNNFEFLQEEQNLEYTLNLLSQEILNVIKLKKINFLESLIQAQDERWRHA